MAELRTPQTDRGPGSDRVSGESETRRDPAMARLLRASCLLSLLLAGFVPPSRGQEKSKVSEPRSGGPREPTQPPGVHLPVTRYLSSRAPLQKINTRCKGHP